MKIAFITAGAAGMYCGSCMHDNTLASFLNKAGHDALLIPTYTPIRTDEEDVSQKRVFFGGINVYLQQKSWLFRHTPRFLDRLFDVRRLLQWVSPLAQRTKYSELGDLTISMLQGTHGKQRKEVTKLVEYLKDDVKPDIILMTNLLLSGIVPELKQQLNKPILGMLQGDDIFLDALPEADRKQAIALIQSNAQRMDGYISTSSYYADFMSKYLGLPRNKIDVVYPGINTKGHGTDRPIQTQTPFTIGYFARICPEKGLHQLIDAYILLRQQADIAAVKLKISGWLGENNRPFFAEQMKKIETAGLQNDVEYVESPDHASKVRFLQSIDVLSVPTTYREPKGLYILEAWMNGVPVVQPRHGSFPELVDLTNGGLLVDPDSAPALADGLSMILKDSNLRQTLAEHGRKGALTKFTAEAMTQETVRILQKYIV